jgi:hypothetical protein
MCSERLTLPSSTQATFSFVRHGDDVRVPLEGVALGRDFHGLHNESDPAVGDHLQTGEQTMSIPTISGSMRIAIMRDFVTVRGGGYFFLPGKEAVDFLTS